MTSISAILKGIYGHMTTAVVVYDDLCRIIWENEKGTDLSDELKKEIAKHLFVREKESGSLPFGKGGRFHTIEISGEKYITVEIYDISPITALYSDPSIADYAINVENRIRMYVSAIAYSSGLMQGCGTFDQKNAALIIKNCIKIIREVMIGSQISMSLFGRKDETWMRGSVFMEEIAEGCRKTLNNAEVLYKYEHCGAFKSDKYLMTLLLLSVCNIIIDSSVEYKELEFYARNRGDKLVFGIKALNCMAENASPHIRDLINCLCELLGVRFSEMENGAEIIVSERSDDDFLEFNEQSEFDGSIFSPYRLFLYEKNDSAD